MSTEFFKVFIIFLIIVFLWLLFYYFLSFFIFSKKSVSNVNYNQLLEINGYKIKVEIADTTLKRIKGLSGRKSLNEDEGMLFIFDTPQIQRFWMKDMNFPIDIVWLAKNEVVGYVENVLPEIGKSDFELSIYQSPSPVDKVLELKAGMVKKMNIKIGDVIFFK